MHLDQVELAEARAKYSAAERRYLERRAAGQEQLGWELAALRTARVQYQRAERIAAERRKA